MITVTGLPTTSARVRWLNLTPWIGSRFQTHISIPGGEGIGVTYDRGSDNRVATITGIVSWEGDGETFLNRIGGKLVTVKRNDNDVEIRAITSSPNVTEYQGATIRFTMTMTEVAEEED